MTFSVLALGSFNWLLMTLIWVAFGVLNLWIWQKGKAQGNMLMMIGGFLLALIWVLLFFESNPGTFLWQWGPVIGSGLILAGFYMTSAKLIEAQMAGIKAKLEKLKEATSEKDNSDAS
jgi:Na+/proline symporter